MNPLDRPPAPPPDDPIESVLWELRKGDRIARCELWRHPVGFEVHVDVDGDTRQTAANRRRDTAEDLSEDWQTAFKDLGWS